MTDRPSLERFDSPDAAADAAAGAIAERLIAAVLDRGLASLCVTGGTSPGPVYDRLAVNTGVNWRHVGVTLSDERWVDEASAESNARLVRDRLLKGPAAAANFISLKGEETDLEHGAWVADLKVAPLVPFDVALLGMGEDGHVASLFPGNPVLAQGLDPAAARLALPAPAGAPAPPQDRVSLTLHALSSARLLLIYTSGEAKRAILERPSLEHEGDLPVHHLIRAAAGEVRLLWTA